MKNLIILILISLSIFAQDNQNFKKPSKEALEAHKKRMENIIKESNPYIGDFTREADKIWSKYKFDEDFSEEFKLSKERAEIDIAKAEIQKLFLEYIKQEKFREDYELRIKLESKNGKEEIKTKTNEKIKIQMK